MTTVAPLSIVPLRQSAAPASKATWESAALWLVALACSLPMLVPLHVAPLPSFYEEWLGAVLLLSAAIVTAIASRGTRLYLPVAIAPILGLLCVIGIQLAVGRFVAPEFGQMALLYVLALLLAAWVGGQLTAAVGRTRVTTAIATAIAIGATLNGLIGIVQIVVPLELQLRAWYAVTPLIRGSRAYGNLAQPNLLAHYLVAGVVALGYLRSAGRIKTLHAVLAGAPLLVALALTGSRMAIVLLGTVAALSAWYGYRSRDLRAKPIARFAIIAFFAFVLLNPLLDFLGWNDPSRSILRRFEWAADGGDTGAGMDVRLTFWWQALRMFWDAPIIGQGIGVFAWEFFQRGGDVDPRTLIGGTTHAHNLFAHFLAETGVLGTLAVAASLVIWWVGRLARLNTPAHWFAAAIIAIACAHSMLEYPLWYMHFLVLFGLVLGMGGTKAFRTERQASRGPLIVMLAGAAGLAIAAGLFQQRSAMISTLQVDRAGTVQTEESRERDYAIVARLENSLFRPWVEPLLIGGPIVREQLDALLELNTRVVRYRPFPYAVCRQMVLLGLKGRGAEAAAFADSLVNVFRSDAPGCLASIREARLGGVRSLKAAEDHLEARLRALPSRKAGTTAPASAAARVPAPGGVAP